MAVRGNLSEAIISTLLGLLGAAGLLRQKAIISSTITKPHLDSKKYIINPISVRRHPGYMIAFFSPKSRRALQSLFAFKSNSSNDILLFVRPSTTAVFPGMLLRSIMEG